MIHIPQTSRDEDQIIKLDVYFMSYNFLYLLICEGKDC